MSHTTIVILMKCCIISILPLLLYTIHFGKTSKVPTGYICEIAYWLFKIVVRTDDWQYTTLIKLTNILTCVP